MNNFGNNNRKQLDGKFEQQFKNKFENAQFAPPAHLWEQIDAALDAKPWYKRPLFYRTSGLVAALLLVVMFWFTVVYDNSTTPSNNEIVNTDKIENRIDDGSKDKNTDNSSSTNEETGTIQTPSNDNKEVTNSETNQVQKNEFVTTSDKNSISSKTNNVDNSTSNTSKDDSDVAISIVTTNTKDKKDKNKDLATTATDKVVTETTTTLEFIVFKEIDWSKYLPVGNPYFEQEEIFIKVDSTNEAIANNKGKNPTEESKKSSGIALTFGINHTQGIYKPTFRTDSIHDGLKVIGAYRFNLADTLPQMNISGTYQQTGFDVALAFGKNQRWSFNTGVGMGKANYSFGSTNYIPYVSPDIPLGDSLIMLPINQVEVNYEWLQVPIAIGYQFGESRAKKFSGFAQLGTAIEFLRSYSYTSADPRFTYALGEHRTTNTHVWTQVGVNYHVTNRWTLWGGGTYKSSLSSLINENGVTFSSQAYGWQVGTRFTIFKSGK